jgi:hypothetical protein
LPRRRAERRAKPMTARRVARLTCQRPNDASERAKPMTGEHGGGIPCVTITFVVPLTDRFPPRPSLGLARPSADHLPPLRTHAPLPWDQARRSDTTRSRSCRIPSTTPCGHAHVQRWPYSHAPCDSPHRDAHPFGIALLPARAGSGVRRMSGTAGARRGRQQCRSVRRAPPSCRYPRRMSIRRTEPVSALTTAKPTTISRSRPQGTRTHPQLRCNHHEAPPDPSTRSSGGAAAAAGAA